MKKKTKTANDRVAEVVRIAEQLRDHDIYDVVAKELRSKWEDFIRDGATSSGSVFVESLDRYVDYQFSTKADSYVRLRRKLQSGRPIFFSPRDSTNT